MIAAKSLSELARCLGSRLQGADAAVDSISIDSRTLEPGQLFVAVRGPNFDGHDYIEAAMARGAAGVLVSRPPQLDCPWLQVADTDAALTLMGKLNRDAFGGTVLGVTGSSGKTSVKEMLASILSQSASVLATAGNLNNAYGVPLTLGRLTAAHTYAVVEMGTSHPGEIADLTAEVRPDFSMVNNALHSHIAGLGSLEGVAEEKGAIYDRLPAHGGAVVNRDDPFCDAWIARIKRSAGVPGSQPRIATFSLRDKTATAWADQIEHCATGIRCVLHLDGQQAPVSLRFRGRHNVANACAAAAMAWLAGQDIHSIVAGLQATQPGARRGQWFRGREGCIVIDESYNANRDSLRAAIDTLAVCTGCRMLVVSDLSAEQYTSPEEGDAVCRELGRYARSAGIDRLFTCGQSSAVLQEGFQGEGRHFADRDALAAWLPSALTADTVVLVKGSRVSAMEAVVEACRSEEVTAKAPAPRAGEPRA